MNKLIIVGIILILNSCFRYIIDKKEISPGVQLEYKTGLIVYFSRKMIPRIPIVKDAIINSANKAAEQSNGKLQLIGVYEYDGKIWDQAYWLKKQKKKNVIEITVEDEYAIPSFLPLIMGLTFGAIPVPIDEQKLFTVAYNDSNGEQITVLKNETSNNYPTLRSWGGLLILPLALISPESNDSFYEYSFEYNLKESVNSVLSKSPPKADFSIVPFKEEPNFQFEIRNASFTKKTFSDVFNKKRIVTSIDNPKLTLFVAHAYFKNLGKKPIKFSPWKYSIAIGKKAILPTSALVESGIDLIKKEEVDIQPNNEFVTKLIFIIPAETKTTTLSYQDTKLIPDGKFTEEFKNQSD